MEGAVGDYNYVAFWTKIKHTVLLKHLCVACGLFSIAGRLVLVASGEIEAKKTPQLKTYYHWTKWMFWKM